MYGLYKTGYYAGIAPFLSLLHYAAQHPDVFAYAFSKRRIHSPTSSPKRGKEYRNDPAVQVLMAEYTSFFPTLWKKFNQAPPVREDKDFLELKKLVTQSVTNDQETASSERTSYIPLWQKLVMEWGRQAAARDMMKTLNYWAKLADHSSNPDNQKIEERNPRDRAFSWLYKSFTKISKGISAEDIFSKLVKTAMKKGYSVKPRPQPSTPVRKMAA